MGGQRVESSGAFHNHHLNAYYHEARIIFDSDGNYMRTPIPLLAVLLLLTISTSAQVKSVAQYIEQVQALSNRTQIKAANDYIDRNHESILREWIAITEINAPSGQEQPRAKYIESLLRKYHLDEIRSDSTGNLIAVRKGTGGGPRIVFDAHLDTVFQPELQIKATIRDGKIYAPGIGDDTRNIEALLATIRALNDAKVKTKAIWFSSSPCRKKPR
jgi:hypothetical protein